MERLTVGIDLKTLTRRAFLGTALAGALLPRGRALAQTRLSVGTVRSGELAPFFVALERGFFREAGLEVTVAAMVRGTAIAPALGSGTLNIGWSSVVSVCRAHLEGLDHRFIANGAINKRGTNEVVGFQVAADSPVGSARDLEGKTCAAVALRDILHVAGLHWIDSNGGNSSRVKWIELPPVLMEGALASGKIDGFVAAEPSMTIASKLDRKTRVLGSPLGGIAPRLLIASYFASDAWIRQNVDTVKAFVGALNRGIDAHNAGPEEAKVTLARHTGLKPEIVREMTLPAFEKRILESDLRPVIDVAARYRILAKTVPPREVISKHAAL